MSRPDVIILDGRAYSWRQILALRRAQLEEWKKARPDHPALFEIREDHRPKAERSASGRYREPTFLSWLQEEQGAE